MNRLTIKLRVTLWYTALMLMIVALVLGFMLLISGSVMETDAKQRLMSVVEANTEEIEYDHGELELDDDLRLFKGGVYSIVYSEKGEIIAGDMPNGFYSNADLQDKIMQTVTVNGNLYYMYDRLIRFEQHEDVWIRGIVSADENSGLVHSIFKISLFALPLLTLLAAVGGYYIARRSFHPIEQIRRAAEEIGEGKDLSRRIGLGAGHDEIHQLADTFDHMFSRLEASFEMEKQFTSDASHELRTPTAVILAQCEYALSDHADEIDKQEALETIQRQAMKMSRLITQLLSVTRLERGIDTASLERVDMSELTRMVCEEQSLLSTKGIELTYDIMPDVTAYVDRSMMIRLLTNLIRNAYCYGKENGHIWVSLRADDKSIVLSVQDDGIGIAKAEQDKIWQRFYQIESSRTAKDNGGMGLGLAMVKQIADLHKGVITVDSEVEKGSTFTLKLPRNTSY